MPWNLNFFYSINAAVFTFVIIAWLIELVGLNRGAPLITERVVLALIGGTVAQRWAPTAATRPVVGSPKTGPAKAGSGRRATR